MTHDLDLLGRIRARHGMAASSDTPPACSWCGVAWPCDAALLLSALDARGKAMQVPQRLYDAEIGGRVEWYFDAGVDWMLWARSEAEPDVYGHADTYEQALTAMAHASAERSPDGPFAKWWREK